MQRAKSCGWALGFVALMTSACGSSVHSSMEDAAPVDAGAVDAGAVDAGAVDAGAVDAGAVEIVSELERDCSPECASEERCSAGVCVPDRAARLVAPASLGETTLRRPTLRWTLPQGSQSAVVELCEDRACARRIERIPTADMSARPSAALRPRSVVFWRVIPVRDGVEDAANASATWLFRTPLRDASGGADTSIQVHNDVNGDGYDDLAVASSWQINPTRYEVVVRVYLGGPTGLRASHSYTWTGRAWWESSLSWMGDLNGDGFADFVLRNALFPEGDIEHKGVVVFYGSDRRITAQMQRTVGALSVEGGAGDVNGDGLADWIVSDNDGAPAPQMRCGVRLSKRSSFAGPISWGLVLPPSAQNRIDTAVRAGDVNGDGFADIAVGQSPFEINGSAWGRVVVNLGSPSGVSPERSTELLGDEWIHALGPAVRSAGDVDGDGYGDLVAGAGGSSPNSTAFAGAFAVYRGSSGGLRTERAPAVYGTAWYEALGAAVAVGGDVNGDGFGDVLIGAAASPSGMDAPGRASLYLGSVDGLARSAAWAVSGQGHQRAFTVVGLGDVNGDGYSDFAVGAPGLPIPNALEPGSLTVYLGGASVMALSPSTQLVGSDAFPSMGSVVAQ